MIPVYVVTRYTLHEPVSARIQTKLIRDVYNGIFFTMFPILETCHNQVVEDVEP